MCMYVLDADRSTEFFLARFAFNVVKYKHFRKDCLEILQDGDKVGHLLLTENGWISVGLELSDNEELLQAVTAKLKELNTYA